MVPQITITCTPIIVDGVPGYRASVYCQTGGTPEAFGAEHHGFAREIALDGLDATEMTPEGMLSVAMDTITQAVNQSMAKLDELRSS